MQNARRILLILILIAVFVILAQRLDQFTGPPATTSPVTPAQQLPKAAAATATPIGYPFPPTETPQGPYPPPKPTATLTPEGYQPPESR
ncbi:MAG: hypothetical protein D6791_03500 [Chloroflexi bacterium]|nr:MAG: hypothetical protein D6791_03500 [Chloroflexota bacterium]